MPKVGDKRESDGRVYAGYSQRVGGKKYETWLSPEAFERRAQKKTDSNAKWRADPVNADLSRQRAREWGVNNRERKNTNISNYWKRNPSSRMVADAKQRAKKQGVPFEITKNDVIIPISCPVFGTPLFKNYGGKVPTDSSPELDRIIPSLGYVKGNVVVVSRRANRAKSNLSIDELEMIVKFYRGLSA